MEKSLFGYTQKGEKVESYTLVDGDLSAEILNYGGIIRSFTIQTTGGPRDIALGFDDMDEYEADVGYIGALVGRVANRIGNACFELNGTKYQLDANNGPNCLHSGSCGYNKRIWNAQVEGGALALRLRDTGGCGCVGFPGNLEVEVRYTLSESRLGIEYHAVCDEDTPISLTNHCYFNLGGHGSGSIENHEITIISDYITPIDANLIPTGGLMDVTNTPFDLRKRMRISKGISSRHQQIALGGGYDHNFVLSNEPNRKMSLASVAQFDGLVLECRTTQPGIQFYSGNFLSGQTGKGGLKYDKRSGFCLETQNWPDAVNHSGFPDTILRKGEIYSHKTEYVLRVER